MNDKEGCWNESCEKKLRREQGSAENLEVRLATENDRKNDDDDVCSIAASDAVVDHKDQSNAELVGWSIAGTDTVVDHKEPCLMFQE